MIQQIQPQINYPISRLLPDLFDSVTYYVQAVVRNATTNAVLATIPLASQGNRIYASLWRTPADTSGQGLYITITSTAYTDAGFTMQSTKYAAASDTFMIYDQFHLVQSLGMQINALASVDIDYKKIESLLRAVLKKEIKIPTYEQIDHTKAIAGIYTHLLELKTIAGAIKMPEPTEITPTDLSPVLAAFTGIHEHIEKRFDNMEKPDKVDLGPLSDQIGALDFNTPVTAAIGIMERLIKGLESSVGSIPDHTEAIEAIHEKIADFQKAFAKSQEPKVEAAVWPTMARDGSIREKYGR